MRKLATIAFLVALALPTRAAADNIAQVITGGSCSNLQSDPNLASASCVYAGDTNPTNGDVQLAAFATATWGLLKAASTATYVYPGDGGAFAGFANASASSADGLTWISPVTPSFMMVVATMSGSTTFAHIGGGSPAGTFQGNVFGQTNLSLNGGLASCAFQVTSGSDSCVAIIPISAASPPVGMNWALSTSASVQPLTCCFGGLTAAADFANSGVVSMGLLDSSRNLIPDGVVIGTSGFRYASVAQSVPEPASIVTLLSGLTGCLVLRRYRNLRSSE